MSYEDYKYEPEEAYYNVKKQKEVKDSFRKLQRQYLRYKEAEIVYSIQHKKLLEMAGKAGALYRIDGTVLINREIFDEYLEQFREPAVPQKSGRGMPKKSITVEEES